MLKNKVLVRQADGSIREVQISDGGKVSLRGNEQLLIAAAPEQAEVRSGEGGKVAIRLEGIGEFTVESQGLPPEALAMGPDESPVFRARPVIVFERAGAGGEEGAVTHDPLGVHEASVADTTFLDQQTGEDFGMGQLLGMAAFSAEAGDGLAKGKVLDGKDEEAGLLSEVLSDDSGQDHSNLPPVIEINTILLVDDDATEALTGHLRATDLEGGPGDLRFRISQGPAYGTLYIDGKEVDATKVTFTQADIDSGRVAFRFDPHAQDRFLVLEDDTFVFTVTDGTDTTGPATFHIHNSTVQVWGTDESDDLTGAAHFDRDGAKFHVYGFDGNDTLRGGSGADTLDGGGHAYAVNGQSALDGGDTADYGASTAAVDVDLTRTIQSGGHAEGDSLIDIENVIGSGFDDSIVGDAGNNHLTGLDGDDTLVGGGGNDMLAGGGGNDMLVGGAGSDTFQGGAGADTLDGGGHTFALNRQFTQDGGDTVDYGASTAAVDVDLTRTIQSGGHAEGDSLIDIENVIGSGFDDSIVGDAGHNHLTGLDGNDTLVGGAGRDTLQGGAGNDLIRAGAGDVVDGGAASDTLVSEDESLDVTSSTTITGIERIDLTGACKGLTVSGAAILSNGVADPAGSGFMALMVTGDAGDSVARLADGGWTWTQVAPEVTIDGQTYVLYEAAKDSQTVRLYVQTGLNEAEVAGGAIQIWGTEGADDLTTAWDFNDPRYTFHVHGLDGNDTMRGGSGADTLDGGGHAYAAHTPWLYTQEGGDTVDYGASSAAVNIDLTRATQSGGHAEGDVLIGVENVIGSAHADSITGDAAANLLAGLGGNDTLRGGGGNDTLRGGAGADLIDGGLGLDFADYRDSASWVAVDLNIQDGTTAQSGGGTDNDALGDTLIGIEHLIGSNDASYGDVLTGNAAGNHLIGLDGDDTLIGNSGNDTLVGGAGADRLNGGSGTRDLADYSASTAWVNVDLTRQDGTAAQIGGGAGNHAEGDILTGIEDVNGSAYADSILGNTAINVLSGYGGNDTISAGNGNDTVHGGDGDDSIDGGGQADELFGDSGNDTIYGGDSIDTLFGGAGDDVLYGHRSDGGSDGNQDLLLGGTGNDTLVSLSTVRSKFIGCQGADRIMGGGIDYVSYELTGDDFTVNYGQSVYVDLRIQDGVTAQSGGEEDNDAVGDVLTGIRHILGTYGMTGDTLIGNDEANEIYGLGGHDLLVGGGGDDTLWGYDHNDTLEGGAGADMLWGGMHYDMVSYEHASQGVSIDLGKQSSYGVQSGVPGGEEVGDQLWYIDGVIGSAHDDTLIGSSVGDEAFAPPDSWAWRAASNRLEGGAGDDLLMGLGAPDTLDGGDGIDTADYRLSEAEVYVDLNLQDSHTAQTGGGTVTSTLSTIDDGTNPGVLYGGNHAYGDMLISIENLTGSAYHDTLIGNNEDNVLSGLAGDDSLIGGGGDDTLVGGAGNDTLQGGDGTDLIRAGAGDVVDGGAGHDVLISEDEYLDVSSSTAITGVERIDLTGACKGLTVSGAAILTNGVADPAGSGLMALVVTGDVGDSVARLADGGWTWTLAAPEVTIDGQTYVLYEAAKDSQTVRLYVQTGLNEAEVAGGAIQIWGTEGADDLTTAWDFNDPRYTFHVHGLDGNDTMRGGSGADTLDGGGHAYAAHTPWLYTQEGGDTVDYGASSAAVNIDLTRATQSGGHAEGDVLIGVENVIGSAHADSITGDAAANLLAGLGGNDTLRGGGGNDTLRGGAGADLIDGGLGLDFADYRDSASWVAVDLNIQDGTTAQSGGGADNDALGDTLIGIENLIGSNDASYGDVLTGNAAGNHLIGLDGDDTLIGNSGNDTLVGGAGADRLNGGTGTRDLADYSASTAWVNVDLTRQDGTTAQTGGGAGNHAEGDILTGIEDVNGSAYADSILGNTAINVLSGYGGNDTISAGNGNDTVHGGDGDDSIDGGGQADELFGDSGNDTIYGGDSIDTLFGGAGDDVLYGHRSDGGSDGNQDLLLGGTGNDTLVSLSTVRSKFIGCQGADRIMGGGIDYVSYELTGDDFTVNYGQSVYVDLRIQDGVTAQSGGEDGNDAVGDVLTGIRHILGTYGMTGDTLIGNDEANEIYGLGGHDLLVGGGGIDTLWGSDHNDTLEGGAGADMLWGGMHYDMVSYEHASQGVSIDLRNQSNYGVQSGMPGGEENGDQLWYIDGVIGSAHDDTLIGGSVGDEAFAPLDSWAWRAASNRLEGGAGDDLLMGLGAPDTLDGGDGIDTADYSLSEAEVYVDLNLQDSHTAQTGGGTVTVMLSTIDDGTNQGVLYGGNHAYGDVLISIENLTGSAYNDTLIGNGEDNVLSGLAGDDSLVGGAGHDILVGGDGNDLTVGGFMDSVDGGNGFDTFRLEGHAGTGSVLDLTAMNDAGRITGIEQIDIAGDADDANTLTLKASDVLDTTGGADTLWVHGGVNDSVSTTDTGWTHVGVEAGADGQQYDHYSGYAGLTLVNLMIDTDIANQNVMHA